ncbi:hypothetical protein ScPMuIL_000271 [Solemya velum]
MVKKLQDVCLTCIQNKLDIMPTVARALPTVYKELLLERLASHDMFYEKFLPHITYNLFVDTLTTVRFDECKQLTDDILKQLGQCKCQLKHLVIYACPNVTDIGIQEITRGQNELSNLVLQKLPSLTHRGLTYLKSEKLKSLNLKDCVSITTEGVVIIVNSNPFLKELVLEGCSKVDDKVFKAIAMVLQDNLERLYTGVYSMSDDSLGALSEFCPNLLSLNLYGCTRIGGTALIKLFQGCTKLHSLDLSYCNLLRQFPECFWTIPTSLIPALNDTTFTKVLQHIGHNLKDIDVSGGIYIKNLTDKGLSAVSKYCIQLESLLVTYQVNITGITLLPLLQDPERAGAIKKLHLSCKKLDPNVLYQVVTSCINLEQLELGGLNCVSDEILTALAENCTHLRRLGIKGCRMVTDLGICELARRCPLQSLILAGVNTLTDKCIFAIANNCHYLDEISLNGCAQVSPTAVRYLKDCCIPRLWKRHATPNAVHDQLMAKNLDTGEFCRADLLLTS